jgi:sugar phosphate isomerase/epimerase
MKTFAAFVTSLVLSVPYIALGQVDTAERSSPEIEAQLLTNSKPIKIAVMETAFKKRADVTSFVDAKKAGYNAIQMHTGNPKGDRSDKSQQSWGLRLASDPSILKSWQAASKKHDVKIISLCAGCLNRRQIWGKDKEISMRIARQTIDACHALEINLMLFPFFGPSNFQTDEEAFQGVAEFLKELLPYAEEKNVIIGIEAPVTTVRVIELLQRLEFPKHLKIYYDTGNLFDKEDIYQTIQKHGQQHFCEIHIKAAGHKIAGQGKIDLERLAKSLNAAKYDKWLVYEANRNGKAPESNRMSIEKIVDLRKSKEN